MTTWYHAMITLTNIDPFILRATTGAIGIAIIAGIVGCFIVWRKMAYFSDSLAHSSLLGIALGIVLHINLHIGMMVASGIFALLLLYLQHKRLLATDTLLGILAHSALAIGLVTLSVLHQPSIDLHRYLFGNILTITNHDIYWIYGGGTVILFLLGYYWPKLLLMTIDEDLAKAEGIATFKMQLLTVAIMTILVAVSIHLCGILLITSLLIIPAATARQCSRSPEAMALLASFFGFIAAVGGICLSFYIDTPVGPTIVTCATALFILILLVSSHLRIR